MSNGYDSTEAFLSGIERELKEESSSGGGGRAGRDYDRRDRGERRRRYDDEDVSGADDRSRRRRGLAAEDDYHYESESRRSSSRKDYDYDRRGTSEYRRRDEYNRDRDRDAYRGGSSRRSGDGRGYDYNRSGRDDRFDDRHYGRRADDRRGYGGGGSAGGAGVGGGSWRDGPGADANALIRRSPTPPGTIPISQHARPHSKWNIAAPGYESMSAMDAKATGMFGIVSQSRIQGATGSGMSRDGQGNPIVPPAGAAQSGLMASMGGNVGAQNSRQFRRLYVGNLNADTTDMHLCSFFNAQMRRNNFTIEEGDPAIAAQVNAEKGYAFIEFRSAGEATNAMSFDGIVFQGQSLKIRRPKDYVGPEVSGPETLHVPGLISTNVPDGPNKIYIGGLPTYLNEDQVIDLLKAFGDLRSFNLVRESGVNGASKGFAFCEYIEPTITDLAIQGLNDMEVGDKRLLVQRASVGSTGQRPLSSALPPPMTGANSTLLSAPTNGGPGEPTKAMMLLNCVTAEELLDAEEYQEIVEDMREECSKYGHVVDMRIPRPEAASKGAAAQTWKQTKDGEPIDKGEEGKKEREGVGRVYVLFDKQESCKAALQAIAGRQFGGRTVIAAFIAEESFPSNEDGGRDAAETSMQAMRNE